MNTSDLRMFSCSLRACSLASFALHSSTRTEKKCYMLLLYRPKPQVKPCCPKIINTTQQISSQTNSTTQLTRHALTVTHLFCMSLGTHVHLVYMNIPIYIPSRLFPCPYRRGRLHGWMHGLRLCCVGLGGQSRGRIFGVNAQGLLGGLSFLGTSWFAEWCGTL